MVEVTINNIEFKMDFKTLCNLIRTGAFDSDTDIMVKTIQVIWLWNKSTEGETDSMFKIIGFKK